MSIRIQRARAPDGTIIRLRGPLDESLDPLFLDGLRGRVVIDLDEVGRVTSFGVREWLRAVRPARASLYFVRARPSMVAQFNTVDDFSARGRLVSLYAPFQCEHCGHYFQRLIDLRHEDVRRGGHGFAYAACERCHNSAELDDLFEQYFACVFSQAELHRSPALDRLLETVSLDESSPLRVRKRVVDDCTYISLAGPLSAPAHVRRALEGLEGTVVVDLTAATFVERRGIVELLEALDVAAPLPVCVVGAPADCLAELESAARNANRRLAAISLIHHAACERCGEDVQIHVSVHAQTGPEPSFTSPCPSCGAMAHWELDPGVVTTARRLAPSAPVELPADLATPSEPVARSGARSSIPSRADVPGYEVVRRLGVGGMAEAFLARRRGPEGFSKLVVVKRIFPHLAADATFIEMFIQEAQLGAHVSHPNVAQVFDFHISDTAALIAMEYVDGVALQQLIAHATAQGTTIPVRIASRVLIDALEGLHAIHMATSEAGTPLGIVHRDVSPQNIIVSRAGMSKVIDLGIAKIERSRVRSSPGQLKGNLRYLAPEQIDTAHSSLSAASDVFTAAVVFYECLAGKHPFAQAGGDFAAMLHAVVSTPPPPPPDCVPPALREVIRQALARAPADRFATAHEFAKALAPFAALPTDVAEYIESLGVLPNDPGITNDAPVEAGPSDGAS